MTNKYTPGPWFVYEIETDGNPLFSISTSPTEDDYESGVDNTIAGAWVTKDNTEEQRANAKLIAAAPELLEALRPFYEYIKPIHAVIRPEEWGAIISVMKKLESEAP